MIFLYFWVRQFYPEDFCVSFSLRPANNNCGFPLGRICIKWLLDAVFWNLLLSCAHRMYSFKIFARLYKWIKLCLWEFIEILAKNEFFWFDNNDELTKQFVCAFFVCLKALAKKFNIVLLNFGFSVSFMDTKKLIKVRFFYDLFCTYTNKKCHTEFRRADCFRWLNILKASSIEGRQSLICDIVDSFYGSRLEKVLIAYQYFWLEFF